MGRGGRPLLSQLCAFSHFRLWAFFSTLCVASGRCVPVGGCSWLRPSLAPELRTCSAVGRCVALWVPTCPQCSDGWGSDQRPPLKREVLVGARVEAGEAGSSRGSTGCGSPREWRPHLAVALSRLGFT